MHLTVPAHPDSLALVRALVGGAARTLGLSAGAVADVRLALTETCSSAIRRADEHTTIDIVVEAGDGTLRITICDDGEPQAISGGVPLPLVAAITDAIELTHRDDGSTAVAISFRLP